MFPIRSRPDVQHRSQWPVSVAKCRGGETVPDLAAEPAVQDAMYVATSRRSWLRRSSLGRTAQKARTAGPEIETEFSAPKIG